MDSLPVFVGLDYHMATVQVCVLDSDDSQLANHDCSNNWQTLGDFVGRFSRPVRAAVESCCGAANLAEELVSRAGWSVALAHPGYVARMKQNPDKTDFHDTRMVADLERVGYLPRVWLAPLVIRELRRVIRYRQQLANQRRATKLRLRALLREQRCRPPDGLNPWTRVADPDRAAQRTRPLVDGKTCGRTRSSGLRDPSHGKAFGRNDRRKAAG